MYLVYNLDSFLKTSYRFCNSNSANFENNDFIFPMYLNFEFKNFKCRIILKRIKILINIMFHVLENLDHFSFK